MKMGLKAKIVLVLVLAVSCLYTLITSPPTLGLDLQGGTHFLLRVRTEEVLQREHKERGADFDLNSSEARQLREDTIQQVVETLRNRVDQLGVAERQVQRQGLGSDRILIQLPGLHDLEQAKRVIGKVAELQFRIVKASAPDRESLLASAGPGTEILPGELPGSGGRTVPGFYLLESEIPASGRDLETAKVGRDQYRQPSVDFMVRPGSAHAFAKLTGENLGKQLAIVLDGQVKSAPNLHGKISTHGQISGHFTNQEAYELALTLRSGALPASVEYLEQSTVGPTLGTDSIQHGRDAMILGTLAVVAFLIMYYRSSGLNAVIGLGFTMLLILAGLSAFDATLTMPGIAGLVLTLGMAVDANVVIFERMRDELKLGKTVRVAVSAGFEKAFSAIADSNISTLIAAFVLLQFGTGPVRGFGVTLAIGVAASLFSALVISRLLYDLALRFWKGFNLRFRVFVENTKIDFFRMRYVAVGVSLAIVLAGAGAMGYHRIVNGSALNWGIDFSGGALLQVQFQQKPDLAEVRGVLHDAGFEPMLQQMDEHNEVLLRAEADEVNFRDVNAQMLQALKQHFEPQNQVTQRHSELVQAQVGHELKYRAALALALAVVCTLIYLSLRFEFPYALGAVVASFHDALIMVAFFAISRMEVDLTIVAALLTIVGYSLNDTIVIFDRVRENQGRFRREGFIELINESLNAMLSRTILTSLMTLLTTLSLLLLGGDVLRGFSAAMLVGILAGSYSTIYITAPVVPAWSGWREKQRQQVRLTA